LTLLDDDIQIKLQILFEYCLRLHKQSINPEMHFFKIPKLNTIDNDIIFKNSVNLIDENFVRGGVDVEGDNSFPWITRITPKGISLVEQLVIKSEQNLPEISSKLKNMLTIEEKIIFLILHCMKNDKIPIDVAEIAHDLF